MSKRRERDDEGALAAGGASAQGPEAPRAVFEALWNATPAPTLAVNGEDRIFRVNPAAEHFFAMSAQSLCRKGLEDVAGRASRLVDLAAQARRRWPHSVSAYAVSFDPHNRELSPTSDPADNTLVDIQVAPLDEWVGALLIVIQPRSVAAGIDLTLTGRGASRSLSGLSAMLAHEIKNPLFGISGAVQLLETSAGDADLELIRLIQEEIERIRALLDRMDAFGEIGLTEIKPVNIHDVLDQARRAAAAGFARRVRFVEAYDPSLPPLPGDRAQLLQAISNLIKNAAEACPPVGGEIHLRTAFRPGVKIAGAGGAAARLPLEVIVADNGPGLSEEIRAHIFEPFVTSKGAGTGLGLPLVAKIVADHGGVIDCQRRQGRTQFRMLLPVWEGEPPAPGERRSAGPEKLADRRVLSGFGEDDER